MLGPGAYFKPSDAEWGKNTKKIQNKLIDNRSKSVMRACHNDSIMTGSESNRS